MGPKGLESLSTSDLWSEVHNLYTDKKYSESLNVLIYLREQRIQENSEESDSLFQLWANNLGYRIFGEQWGFSICSQMLGLK
jgi:hypothetical protein